MEQIPAKCAPADKISANAPTDASKSADFVQWYGLKYIYTWDGQRVTRQPRADEIANGTYESFTVWGDKTASAGYADLPVYSPNDCVAQPGNRGEVSDSPAVYPGVSKRTGQKLASLTDGLYCNIYIQMADGTQLAGNGTEKSPWLIPALKGNQTVSYQAGTGILFAPAADGSGKTVISSKATVLADGRHGNITFTNGLISDVGDLPETDGFLTESNIQTDNNKLLKKLSADLKTVMLSVNIDSPLANQSITVGNTVLLLGNAGQIIAVQQKN